MKAGLVCPYIRDVPPASPGQPQTRRDGTPAGYLLPGSLALPRIPPGRSQIQGERF